MSGLHEAFDEIVAGVPVYGDLDRAIAQAEQERRRRLSVVASLAGAAAVVAVIAGVLAVTRDENRTLQPAPQPAPTESSTAAAEWPGPIRPGVTLPVVDDEQLGPSGNPWRGWIDPQDSAIGQVDIGLLAGWGMKLREDSQLEAWLDHPGRIVEYGLVVDTDGDRVADCQLALSTDASARGTSPSNGPSWRVLLKNLHTGKTDERVGPPYGYPFEFGVAGIEPILGRELSIFIEFLGEWERPCEAPQSRLHWYAYASLTEDGQVTAWDFAPDEGWLQTLPGLAVEFGGRIGDTGWGRDLPLPEGP